MKASIDRLAEEKTLKVKRECVYLLLHDRCGEVVAEPQRVVEDEGHASLPKIRRTATGSKGAHQAAKTAASG